MSFTHQFLATYNFLYFGALLKNEIGEFSECILTERWGKLTVFFTPRTFLNNSFNISYQNWSLIRSVGSPSNFPQVIWSLLKAGLVFEAGLKRWTGIVINWNHIFIKLTFFNHFGSCLGEIIAVKIRTFENICFEFLSILIMK